MKFSAQDKTDQSRVTLVEGGILISFYHPGGPGAPQPRASSRRENWGLAISCPTFWGGRKNQRVLSWSCDVTRGSCVETAGRKAQTEREDPTASLWEGCWWVLWRQHCDRVGHIGCLLEINPCRNEKEDTGLSRGQCKSAKEARQSLGQWHRETLEPKWPIIVTCAGLNGWGFEPPHQSQGVGHPGEDMPLGKVAFCSWSKS